MPTEQPAGAGSEQDIESRLAALDAPTAPAPEDDAEASPQAQADDSTDEQPEEQAQEPEDDGFVELEVDGVKFKAPPKAKDAFMRDADYTRKTQEVSKLQEAAQDRLHFAEAREQLVGAVMQDVANYQAYGVRIEIAREQERYAASSGDLAKAYEWGAKLKDLEREQAQLGGSIQAKAQAHQNHLNAHEQRQWALAVEGAKARIGSYTAEEDAGMAKVAQDLGFTDKELKSRFADPRVLHALYKAAKWDALQKSKPGAVAAVAKAPPVLKPGASQGQRAATESKYKDVRQALKKSGSVDDAARLFMLRG